MTIHYSSDKATTACGIYATGKATNDWKKVTCPHCLALKAAK
jgi:hypothetical protein